MAEVCIFVSLRVTSRSNEAATPGWHTRDHDSPFLNAEQDDLHEMYTWCFSCVVVGTRSISTARFKVNISAESANLPLRRFASTDSLNAYLRGGQSVLPSRER
jgi:hypothetical protein